MQKIPDSRGVPPKILGGLYRAGVAELQQHIIRIRIMSTKIRRLFRIKVAGGTLRVRQESHFDSCTILRPIYTSLLLLDLFIYLNQINPVTGLMNDITQWNRPVLRSNVLDNRVVQRTYF